MVKFLRILVGYRDDLDLQAKWWHRLLTVSSVVLMLAALGLFTAAAKRSPESVIGNMEVLGTLRDFEAANPKTPNVVPEFVALPGRVGVQKPDDSVVERFVLEDQIFCGHVADASEEVLAFIKKNYPTQYADATLEDVTKWLGEAKDVLTEGRGCVDPNDAIAKDDRVIRFKYSTSAEARAWVKAGGEVLMYLVPAILVMMNLYYRGLVYIICGPRRKAEPPAAV